MDKCIHEIAAGRHRQWGGPLNHAVAAREERVRPDEDFGISAGVGPEQFFTPPPPA